MKKKGSIPLPYCSQSGGLAVSPDAAQHVEDLWRQPVILPHVWPVRLQEGLRRALLLQAGLVALSALGQESAWQTNRLIQRIFGYFYTYSQYKYKTRLSLSLQVDFYTEVTTSSSVPHKVVIETELEDVQFWSLAGLHKKFVGAIRNNFSFDGHDMGRILYYLMSSCPLKPAMFVKIED